MPPSLGFTPAYSSGSAVGWFHKVIQGRSKGVLDIPILRGAARPRIWRPSAENPFFKSLPRQALSSSPRLLLEESFLRTPLVGR
jgi:hypothetical protein